MTLTHLIPPRARLLAGASALLLLAACASVPPPTNVMARAQHQLQAARQAQAADYAPVDLGIAEQRLQAAQAAIQMHKYAVARDQAHKSLADGRLAETRAKLAQWRRKVRDQSAENARLRAQLLSQPAAATREPEPGNDRNAGLPSVVTLPQPQILAPAVSTPAPATSSPTRPAPAGGR